MTNTPFTFADYLDFLENKMKGEQTAQIKQDMSDLRNHVATLTTMKRHLKQYQTLKSLSDSGISLN